VNKYVERDGFCTSVTRKLNYFLPRDTKAQEKNYACACHGFHTGPKPNIKL